MKSKSFRGTALAKFIALGFSSSLTASFTADAATSTWNGAVNGVWDTATTANWTGTTFASGDDAVFSGTPINNVATATGITIGTITLNSGFTGSVALTGNNTVNGSTSISGGTLLVTQSGTAVGTVTATNLGTSTTAINSGGQLYVDDEGTGTAGSERILALGNTITGAGTLQARASSVMTNGWSSVNLTGNLSGFGGTLNVLAGSTINRGKVKFTAASQAAVLSSSATVNISNGAQLYLTQAYNYGFGIHLNGGTGGESNGSLRLDNASLDVTGAVTLHADSIISGAGKISGAIGQSGGTYRLTKVGGNTTVLTGTNTYGGGTTVSAGTVSVGNNSALGSGAVTIGGGNLSDTTGVTLANNFTLNNGTTFTAGSGTLALSGNITGSPNGSWNLTPTNKITLGGTNNVTISGNFGGFFVNAGAGGVDVTGSTTIDGNVANQQSGYLNMAGAAALTVKSSGSLAINGTTHSNFPTSIVGQNAAGTSSVVVEGGTFTIGGNHAFAFGNNIATAVGVLTVSSGTATIQAGSTSATDARSFIMLGKDLATGTINLNGGTLESGRRFLRDGAGTADASGAANFVFGGGTLKALASQTDWLNSATVNTNQLPLSSVTTTSASSRIDSNGYSVAINSAISGSGGLVITDSSVGAPGVVTLGGANTYTGTTSVTGGSLAISGSLTGLVSVSGAGSLAIGEAAPSFTMTTLSLPTVALGGGGALSFDVETISSNDQLTVTTPSGLTLNSGGKINLYDYGATNALTTTGTFTLINYSGTLNGAVANLSMGNPRVGYAYSFGNTGSAITVTVALTADTDNDGMPDIWEDAHGLNKLVNDANGNPDHDFAVNIDEYLAGTDPQNAHSDPNNIDDDGLEDNWERSYFGNITAQNGSGDPDGDYANNLAEQAAATDPTSRGSAPDNDGDGISDAWEISTFGSLGIANGTSDFDHDGYSDYDEFIAGTNSKDAAQTPADTDGDGLADDWEISNFGNLAATGAGDPDGDYATNEQEETASTNPNSPTSAPDGDGDGIGDAWEIHFFTNTTTATGTSDFDADTLSDLQEFVRNTDPTNTTSPYNGNAINWGTPATITTDTDIITTGNLVHAGNFRSDSTNVSVTVGAQTILFANRQSQDAAGVLLAGEEARVIAGSGGRQVNTGLFDATGTTVGAAFESVLDSSAWENTDPGPAPGATDMILRVTGANGAALVTGQQYQIQLFYSDDRSGNGTRGQLYHDNAQGDHLSDPVLAGDSKYVIGTFTASSSGYQDIYIQNTSGGGNFPVGINGYVLRTVAANGYSNWAGANAPGQTADQDYDGDGVKNGVEYFMGAAGSTFTANPSVVSGMVTWPKSAGFSGSYIIQTSSNLVTWTTAVTGISDNGSSVVYTLTPSQSKFFVRLLVTPN